MTAGSASGLPAGLSAVCALARFHQLPADPGVVAHQLVLPAGQPAGRDDLLRAARHLGLKARWISSTSEHLSELPLPALVIIADSTAAEGDGLVPHERCVVLAAVRAGQVLLQDLDRPGPQAGIERMAVSDFSARWSGDVLLATVRSPAGPAASGFDITWFIPSLIQYRRLLGEVLGVSLVLQLLALVSPLFFQAVMDKVLVHQGSSTLDVLVFGLVAVMLFETALGWLRTYVFSHTTLRIDVELGSRLYGHLMALPLGYFEARRVGDSVARVRELENIRSFLTGPCLTALLDAAFTVVFIGVMLLYSPVLTAIVLLGLPLYAGIILWATPLLRHRLDQKFALGAENQAMLVETVTGIQTVKAGALEPRFVQRWDRQLAAYVRASFRAQLTSTTAQEAVGLVGKLVHAATLWWGAHLVMASDLTVGQFVAFNMFAGRVSQPVMRLAQLWMDIQQAGISLRRLADVLDAPPDDVGHPVAGPAAARSSLPAIQGRITFKDVRFRYRPDARAVLDGLTIDIRPGAIVGVVGRSGSGKSTLTKLVQRLYRPESGQVLVDGVDIATIDAAQLRRHIGVVLQENLLFHGTVRANIAMTDPGAGLDEVVRAARLAGAHAFISDLPDGYDTVVGEQGCGLSGGQRQRIALARALFGRPRILILDEATSALDYESEAIIQRNMGAICQGRTVIVVAHRLSAVRQAHRILVLDQGRLVEAGPHNELVRRPGGMYARLWSMQGGEVGKPEEVLA